jgi:hypothetical protein
VTIKGDKLEFFLRVETIFSPKNLGEGKQWREFEMMVIMGMNNPYTYTK